MPTVITAPLTMGSGVLDVFIAEERYAIVTTSGGIDVVDLFKGHVISSGTLPSDVVTVAADWESLRGKLYVGTTTSGVFDMSYVSIRNPGSDFSGALVQRFTTTSSPPVSGDRINDLDVRPGRLLIGTSGGVDFIFQETEYSTRTLISGSNAVRLTTSGGYWTTASGVFEGALEINYDLLSTTGTNIIDVDFAYTSTTSPALPGEPPFGVAVSEVNGQLPVIGVATSGGTFVFEELRGSESSANQVFLTADPTISVDFGADAHFTSGELYTATTGTAQIFDMAGNNITAIHTPESGTRGITTVTGFNTVIRAVDLDGYPGPPGAY